jgi:hypothetical protein
MGIRGLARGLALALGALAVAESLASVPAESGQLQLSWVDNTGGQAYFSVERRPTGGAYEQVALLATGVAAYTDTQVAAGMTYCYRVQAYNETGASGYSNEACGAIAGLNVTVTVTGGGTVTSSPAGIACGTDCAESYPGGAIVTLMAVPAVGMQFSGWSGGGCAGTGPCTVTGSGALAVTATFGASSTATPATVALTVTGNPATGPYSVQAIPTSTGDIRVEFWVDGALRRTESSAPYSLFGDSGGVLAASTLGAGSHTVVGKVYAQTGSTVLAEAAITITEGASPPATFNLAVNRSGEGTVVSAPAGISCGADCVESYAGGTAVTLSALPSGSWTFSGWTGGGCSGTAPCTVTLTAASTVTATFTAVSMPLPAAPPAQYTLTVTTSGSGTVTSAPTGIGCGSDCAETYPAGTAVTLKPSSKGGWVFGGWSGACSGTGSCTVTLNGDRAVQAKFVRRQATK